MLTGDLSLEQVVPNCSVKFKCWTRIRVLKIVGSDYPALNNELKEFLFVLNTDIKKL